MKRDIERVCDYLKEVLVSKDEDYGSSFDTTLRKYGELALIIRLEDKMNRLQSIKKRMYPNIKNEKFEDTLLDLAGYAVLYLATREEGGLDGTSIREEHTSNN